MPRKYKIEAYNKKDDKKNDKDDKKKAEYGQQINFTVHCNGSDIGNGVGIGNGNLNGCCSCGTGSTGSTGSEPIVCDSKEDEVFSGGSNFVAFTTIIPYIWYYSI